MAEVRLLPFIQPMPIWSLAIPEPLSTALFFGLGAALFALFREKYAILTSHQPRHLSCRDWRQRYPHGLNRDSDGSIRSGQ